MDKKNEYSQTLIAVLIVIHISIIHIVQIYFIVKADNRKGRKLDTELNRDTQSTNTEAEHGEFCENTDSKGKQQARNKPQGINTENKTRAKPETEGINTKN